MNAALAGFTALILYCLATALLVRQLWLAEKAGRRWALLSIAAALIAHSAVIALADVGGGQLNLGFYSALSLVSWLLVVLVMIGALWRGLDSLGVVVLPVAALTLGLQLAFGAQHPMWRDFGWQVNVHVAFSVFAFAILSLAAAQALLLGVQDHALRRHQIDGPVSALPPLQAMESFLFQLIGLGFALLTLALISGVLFVDDLTAQHLIHKTVLSGCAWIVFGLLLWGRWRFGWRGRTAIRMTLSGVGVLLLAYFGSKLVLELILDRVS